MNKLTLAALAMAVAFGLQSAEAGHRRGNGGGFRINAGHHGVRIHNVQPKFHVNHHIPRHVIAPRVHVPTFHNDHLTHARKFHFGYCFFGNVHTHWSSTIFSPDYGCTIYYCPSTLCWYYWCPPHNCFYPVTYCPLGKYVF